MYSIIDGTSTHLDEAARLWAEATSTRDGDDAVAPLEISRPVIQRVLDNSPRAFLLVVLDADAETVGFAAAAPVPDDAALAELRYVGVSPRIWGGGVGRYLMRAFPPNSKRVDFRAQGSRSMPTTREPSGSMSRWAGARMAHRSRIPGQANWSRNIG